MPSDNIAVMPRTMIKPRIRAGALFAAAFAATASLQLRAGIFDAISGSEQLTAVSSSLHNGYVRTKLPDGSYKPETFAMGEGGLLDTAYGDQFVTVDPTIDDVSFNSIVGMLAGPLARQNYISVRDPNATKLLIMVSWGRTLGSHHVSDGNYRDTLNYQNARLLGFDSDYSVASMVDPSTVFYGRSIWAGMLDNLHADVLSAIEVDRYFVVLRAYDFQRAWKQKNLKLLWETRFSLSERRHDFERDLPGMAQNASLYFGQDSYGLVMKPIPEGHVHVGEAAPVEEPSNPEDGSSFDPNSGAAGDWVRTSHGPPLTIHIDASGNATFESTVQHVVVPAVATTNAGDVTVKVPGWGLIIRGTVKGNRISGSIQQYNSRNSVTLTRIAAPAQIYPASLKSSDGSSGK
jgi:hypothetical protein